MEKGNLKAPPPPAGWPSCALLLSRGPNPVCLSVAQKMHLQLCWVERKITASVFLFFFQSTSSHRPSPHTVWLLSDLCFIYHGFIDSHTNVSYFWAWRTFQEEFSLDSEPLVRPTLGAICGGNCVFPCGELTKEISYHKQLYLWYLLKWEIKNREVLKWFNWTRDTLKGDLEHLARRKG